MGSAVPLPNLNEEDRSSSGEDVESKQIVKVKDKKSKKEKKEKKRKSDHDEKKRKKEKRSKSDKKHKKEKSEKEKILEKEQEIIRNKMEMKRKASNIWLTDELIRQGKFYFFDGNPDADNLLYQGLYRLDVPVYYRQRYCLGMSSKEGLTFNKTGYIVYKRAARENNQTAITRYCSTGGDEVETLTYRKGSVTDIDQDGFVAFGSEIDDPEEKEESFDDRLTSRTRELNSKTFKDPHNISAWMELIRFQDEYLGTGKKQTKLAISEKKISIYERALDDNPSDRTLLLGLLKEFKNVYDSEKLLEIWNRKVMENSRDFRIWKDYINFLKENFTSFTVYSIRETYARALRTLQELSMDFALGRSGSRDSIWDLENAMLDIFTDACYFERSAGYMERSVCLFQALIEFNSECPMDLIDFRAQIRAFEIFWESEAPRAGDDDSHGWNEWYARNRGKNQQEVYDSTVRPERKEKKKFSKKSEEPEPTVALPEVPREEEKQVFVKWAETETQIEQANWVPCRPLMGVGTEGNLHLEDPDRIVLFDDVRDYTFQMTCSGLKIEVWYRFLEFLGVPLHRGSTNAENSQIWEKYLSDPEPVYSVLSRKEAHWEQPSFIADPSLVNMIRNVFRLSMKLFPQDSLLLQSYINFEKIQSPVQAKNYLKSILKNSRWNLQLWNIYGQVEKFQRNFEVARTMYNTALKNIVAHPEHAVLICHEFSQLEIQLENKGGAVSTLCSLVDGQVEDIVPGMPIPAKTRIAKAKSKFQGKLQELGTRNSYFYLWAACYGTFAYLTLGIEPAVEIFRNSLGILGEGQQQEELYTCFLKILQRNSAEISTPPSLLRNNVMEAMRTYPRNELFLAIFLESEARSQISGRIREYFDEMMARDDLSPVVALFAIHSEISRLGSNYRVRSLFEKAIEKIPDNLALWRYYLSWEMKVMGTGRGVLYRAIRYVPGAKALWMDAMSKMSHELNVTELNEIMSLMTEKEIRIRQLPDDFQ
eukprot:TRINITY_DN4825_c0_g1_i1.p1 TRINITY_DN4825_c0_g1~~TRINITY_DN4825_c0_g1_i1.p1  ORF type:complete len:1018 (+),score=364.02 TRINITY_DN4825_c0_g1_i1:86-3055(+)